MAQQKSKLEAFRERAPAMWEPASTQRLRQLIAAGQRLVDAREAGAAHILNVMGMTAFRLGDIADAEKYLCAGIAAEGADAGQVPNLWLRNNLAGARVPIVNTELASGCQRAPSVPARPRFPSASRASTIIAMSRWEQSTVPGWLRHARITPLSTSSAVYPPSSPMRLSPRGNRLDTHGPPGDQRQQSSILTAILKSANCCSRSTLERISSSPAPQPLVAAFPNNISVATQRTRDINPM